MTAGVCHGVLAALLMLGAGAAVSEGAPLPAKVHIDYVEASTGQRWDLGGLPARMNIPHLEIHFHPVYAFDKSPAIDRIEAELSPTRHWVILQECSVYFPGDLAAYQGRVERWVQDLEMAGARVAVATTVPPAADMGRVQNFKNFVKTRLLGRPSQARQVAEFNQWLRGLASERNMPLLDLEAVVRVSETDRHLNPAFDSGDGIHLNARAYELLDQRLDTALREWGVLDPGSGP